MRHAIPVLLAAVLALPAAAQNPTANQMIEQLRPRDGDATTRGVLRIGPSPTPAAAGRAPCWTSWAAR
jgi:hypothetical protein